MEIGKTTEKQSTQPEKLDWKSARRHFPDQKGKKSGPGSPEPLIRLHSVQRHFPIAVDVDGVAAVGGRWLCETPEEVFDAGEALAGFPKGKRLEGVAGGDGAADFDPEGAGVVKRAEKVVLLGDDDGLLDAEDMRGAPHGLVGGEAGVIEENVLGGHPPFRTITPHDRHFVVAFLPVVAAHQDLRRDAGLVELDRLIKAVT